MRLDLNYMGSVTLSDITKIFRAGHDEVVAVEDADLSVDNGEFVVLVGPRVVVNQRYYGALPVSKR